MRAAVRAGIALLFAAVALPAAAQWIGGPHALFQSRLNGAHIRVCGVYTGPGAPNTAISSYTIRDWPAQGAGTLTIQSVSTTSTSGCFNLNLRYTGSFATDQTVRVEFFGEVTSDGDSKTSNGIAVFAADPALVVGAVTGNTTEEGTEATFTVRLRTRPAGNVAVAVTSTDTTEGTVSPASLTFTQGNWWRDQTVTATGVDDAVADGDQSWNVSLNPSSVNTGGTVIDSDYHALANVNVAMTTPDQTGGPTQTAIAVISTPANANGYRVGETIEVRVTFNLAAAVTGTPLLALAIGTEARQARYESGSGTASLTFRYPVLPGDVDADGLSVGATALTLNGGSIRLHGGTVSARLNLGSTITNNASHKVDGAQGVPGVSAIALNRPQVGNAYERLEPIEVTLTFSKRVYVVGVPQLALNVGTATRQAVLARELSRLGRGELVFRYTVVGADQDTDGISIGAGALTLNGAEIIDPFTGEDAVLVLGHHAIENSGAHRVTGGSFNAPKVVSRVIVTRSAATHNWYDQATGRTFTYRTYQLGEVIELQDRFDRPVVVTGTPTVKFQTATKYAYQPLVRADSTPTALSFQFVVGADDRTRTDGLFVNEDIRLDNGATIRDARDDAVDAVRSVAGFGYADPLSDHFILGSLKTAPSVTAVALNAPVRGDTYERGETIEATVTFDRVVDVTGTPRLALGISSNTRQAGYESGHRTRSLTFAYQLVQADVDANGISIAANALTLNSGTIKLYTDTTDAQLGLGDHAVSNDGDHKVDGSKLTPARVDAIYFRGEPASNNTYQLGERIVVAVEFDRPITATTATGQPQFAIRIGDAIRWATPARELHPNRLRFRYLVGPFDRDADGVSVLEGALALNGATINDARDATVAANVRIGRRGFTNAAQYKVDGSLGPPGMVGLALNPPALGDTYNNGETIEATVTFNKAVDVTGTPQLALGIGANARLANYAAGTGSAALVFRYTVASADDDPDGVTIESGALTLNGGTIKVQGGTTDALLTLGSLAFSNDPAHKVDGADTPRAFISATSPSRLFEDNVGGATVTLGLANAAFVSGVTRASFILTTDVPSLSIGAVAPVAAGDTTATLTLAYGNTNFNTPRTLSVTVPASAHTQSGAVTTGTVAVTQSFELRLSRTALSLNENPGSTNANRGTYTVTVDGALTEAATVTVGGATRHVRVDTDAMAPGDQHTLAFDASNWSTPRTVTVTAEQDDDTQAESAMLTHTVPLEGNRGTVRVTVADDDLGRVLVDANPGTAALDAGPLLLNEAAPGNIGMYAVRLSRRPNGNVAVAVGSSDEDAVTVNTNSVAFTPQNWNTAQTLTATAQTDADAFDASATLTHTATGGGYNATSTRLNVAVADGERTGTDYDADGDGLIEISTLAQLNAVRWDPDGDGAAAFADVPSYTAAFGGASAGMGCPEVDGAPACIGYELVQDLDFDTDGDGSTHASGASDAQDAYHNGGDGWDPIGPSVQTVFRERVRRINEESFNAVFDGNGHSIHNLFIGRSRDWSGLFAALRPDAVVRSLGLPNAYVANGGGSVAPLAGSLRGRVEAVWATGSASGNTNVGGLVGSAQAGAVIVASYSTASAACGSNAGWYAGGLVGANEGTIEASYARGAVTGGCATQNKSGLANDAGTATASHWDTAASGVAVSAQGTGRTTAQLQAPTGATGIFAGWADLDVDGDGDPSESPWDFGTSAQYPALAYRGMDVVPQRGDYDLDNDGLIEVYDLAQLNAVRWDLDGDGAPSSGNAASYGQAFRNHVASMGCPTSTVDADENDCTGYELQNDLDFDTDGDGATWTDDGTFAADSGDAYYNGGYGWDPIGPVSAPNDATHFTATFDGNGKVVANLLVNRSRNYSGLFAALRPGAEVRALGLPNAFVRGGQGSVAPLAGAVAGRVAAAWASGSATGQTNVGGLVGTVATGATVVASYSTAAVSCASGNRIAGGFAAVNAGTIAASYSTGAVTGDCPTANKHGFASGTGTFTASYWDVNLSGIADDTGTASPEGETSANLRERTGYSGLYAVWDDQDVDGDSTVGRALDADDDAWDFGDRWQWPVLKFGGLSAAPQLALQPNAAPTFGSGTVADKTYRRGFQIQAFQVPAATGGEGTSYTYSAAGLPFGLNFGAPRCAARTVCGTPAFNTSGAQEVTIYAHDGDTNRSDSDRAALTFAITVVSPTATISSTSPATLAEATLNGAEVTVTLTDATFVSGATSSHFALVTNVPGLTVGSLAPVADGAATATLTLAYTGTDFDTARTVAVRVAAAAHSLVGTMTSLPVPVTTALEATVSPPSLALNENAGSGNNARTFTARLDSLPEATTTLAVASSDIGAARVGPATLTFTTTNWNTAQTVTVTAQADDDANNETVAVTLSAAGVGVVATVPVTVTDDDRGTVLIDADPTTAALDPGPLLLAEGASGSYSVRLSARPTATATVAVASGDTGAVTVDQASLTFTTQNWNTPQTVTAMAVAEATDSVDESVTITHEATGGGYNGTSSDLRVGVSDAERTGTDYDTDEDGLIEISTLAQLNAVRWDLNGDGAPASNSADYSGASGAFAGASTGMGCPTGGCSGYELTQDLDFDTDGDGSTHTGGTSDSDDTYHNGGAGWDPIGPNVSPTDNTHFNATFDGNGHSIHNLFINRGSRNLTGLFAVLRGNATVRSLGLPNAYVVARWNTSPLVGDSWGRTEAVWATGTVRGHGNVGGLHGVLRPGGKIVASYSTASAECTATTTHAGGLVGQSQSTLTAGGIVASYATGAVTGACPTANKHGLTIGGTVAASYWDAEASGIVDDQDAAPPEGRSTASLQTPTSATGIYAGWDALDVDGDGDPHESPWDFGKSSHYPVLSYRGMDPVPQRGDYDFDDDGLIEIRTLAQLNAVRWDLDGDGAPATGSAAGWGKAFRGHRDDMGCPSDTTGDADLNDCTGFELENDLDFDTDGDGATWTDDGTFAADSGDAYHNGGSGWDPIGPSSTPNDTTHFNATFDGNGKAIANLLVNRSRNYSGLFAALRPGAVVRALGLPNVQVRGGQGSVASLAGVSAGRVAAVWASGSVAAQTNVGGLVGVVESGATVVASYSTAAVSCATGNRIAGGFAAVNSGTIAASYATGAVTGDCATANKHGFASGAGTFTASYWDAELSGIADDTGAASPEGETSANLRAPTGYSGLYDAWDDQDVDGDSTVGRAADADDDAWDFGDQWQWPVLKFGGLDVARQIVEQPNMAPTFTGTVTDKTYRRNVRIDPIQIPAATGGEGVGYTYSATGLPAGLNFATPNCASRQVCGTPTANTAGARTVTIYAADGDTNRADSDRAELTFTITVVEPTAALASSPAALTEATLNGAELTVTLTDTTFESGVTAASFILNTNVPGLTVGSLATVMAGDTSATLTLAYNDTDFDTARTLGVTVAAAAHALPNTVVSPLVSVTPSLEAAVSPSGLALNENSSSSINARTFTARLDSLPAATTTVAVASSDTGAARVDTATLTFTTTNWATAQTVTVTAQADDDANNETVAVTLSAAGVGVLATVSVTVADDDRGTVLIDADPATPAREPGPLLLAEGASGSYSVRLSARPTATATVAVTSDDTGAVTVSQSSLTFTTTNWNTPQTVTAMAVAEASDSVDESVTISHEATGGGYGGTTSRLRVGVSDAERTGTDYDTDEDGLIEISTLAQLNAVRWDMNGDGAVSAGNQANYSGASGAFASASTGMGCPTGGCSGYELTQDLDFDTDGDGSTHASGTSDSGRHLPQRRQRLGSHRPELVAERQHALQRRVRRQRPLHPQPLRQPQPQLRRPVRGAARQRVVRSLGLPNAYVNISAQGSAAPLAGSSWGRVEASWASGSVAGNTNVGGLVGSTAASSVIVASYSKAGAQCGAGSAGGLVGGNGGTIVASYATGAITGSCAATNKHGLAGYTGTATRSHWDRETSGVTTSDQGAGRTTAQLKTPTSATGIFAGWADLDVDGDGDPHESPWDFGKSSHYPVLSYRGMDPVPQRGDYDFDDDGLIEIRTLAQLNAVRWDMDGDGTPSTGTDDAANYGKAYRNHVAGMGCPAGDGCEGYELENDLDFDTDGDGATHTGGTSDSGDAYHNAGSGWDPLGPASAPTATTHFDATFDGKGHSIRNLFVNRSRNYVGLFAALNDGATVYSLGLPNARILAGNNRVGGLAGENEGRVAAAWSSGAVAANSQVGGLVGYNDGGSTIVASYSTAAVECAGTGASSVGGGLAGLSQGAVVTSYSTGTVTGNCPRKHGLVRSGSSGTVAASYWDTDRSGINDDSDANPPEGVTSANLRAPTGYTGIYALWDDQDVDGDNLVGRAADADDDAWDFGDQWQWPVLKFGGLDTQRQIALQPNVAPTFTGTVTDKTYRRNVQIQAFQIPAATGGEGAGGYTYTATGLPAGLNFAAPNCAARTVCGTPTTNTTGAQTVTIYAADSDTNTDDGDRGALTFTITVVEPTAALASSPAALTEATLNGAELTVTLTDTTFESGVTTASFILNTNVPGLTVGSLATVTAGDTSATLTLAYNDTDFDTAHTLGVTVAAAAHALPNTIVSPLVPVTPSLEATVSPPSLALTEAATGGANAGTFTAVLDSLPAANTTVTVASSDTGAATVDVASLTFTTTNWATAQTVTVTAQADDDANNETATVTLAAAGVGTLATVSVTVTDDDRGTVLIDANPATPALDPGPMLLAEGDTGDYTVRLSAAPSGGSATVAVASGDTSAVTVSQSSLTFTATNWNTPQTITATAVAEASDAVDESVTISHEATGGGYGGTTSRLRVGVSDAERTGTDYDTDEDGLIEISTLAQLNAVRWDLNGDGAVASGDTANYSGASGAFASASTGMGCPAATCTGYELTQDLDFDTDGDGSTHASGTSDSGDTYHNGGSGWDPIGRSWSPSDSTHFNAVFDGNGHSIHNLYVNRNRNYGGLFAVLRGNAVVRSLGLPNAYVDISAQGSAAPLAGSSWGRVEASWASGSAAGNTNVGGLVGSTAASSVIVASYSKAGAQCGAGSAGGLVGGNGGTIVASYATGAITGSCAATNKHGLAGYTGTATRSHWDRETSGVATSDQGAGRTTAQLKTPTSATGIYAGWADLDVDGDGDPHESPWHFGTSSQYPALSYRGMDPVPQRGDYDLDDDGLIEIRALAQLNAVRWDMDGDGAPASGNAADYGKAFRGHVTGMGCPAADGCDGYELENDLDFDTDGDGSTWTISAQGVPVPDAGDAYGSWTPIGPASTPTATTHFNAVFDGKGHVIENLVITSGGGHKGLFSGLASDAVVRSAGLRNVRIYSLGGTVGSLAGELSGRVAAVWATGAVRATTAVGGLAGATNSGSTIVASYSTAAVECTGTNAGDLAGGLVGTNAGTIAASYSTGAVTGACPTANKHGLSGGSGTFTASYWDVNQSGIADDAGTASPEGDTSANLRAPTGYSGLYALWDDQDVDGDNAVGRALDADDDAWDFGDQWQWPVLKFGGLDVARQIALQPNVAPTFTGTVTDKTYRRNVQIQAFQVPAATGGEGAGGYTYTATGLPAGLNFAAPNCAARTVCGTPTTNTAGAQTVTIYAADSDTNTDDSDRGALTFTVTVVEPTAALTSSPAALTEATLNGAELTVTLTDTTFESGVTTASFILNTNVPGLTVGSLATVTAGDTSATLTLAYNDMDFDTARTLGVTVAAAAHSLPNTIVSPLVPVTPSLEATVSPPSLALTEAATGGANAGTFTAVLDSLPAANTTVTVASSDTGAATVDVASLTFTTTNWATAQTVTVTAQADDDANNETATVTLAAAGVGTLATVSVTVTDDDRGTVLIDANPATPAREPGPLLLAEGDTGDYTVRLSAAPSGGSATVAVASGDTSAVTVSQSSLTFTTANWNTPQTITATAVAEASDAVDESVTISHEATGGGYNGTSSDLRVGVSDAERTGTDYDTDEDGLIEISTLAQLNAVRWDLNGDGAVASGDTANYSGASGAFASASTGMGCPTGGCSGYELTQDLDFDTDGDGASHDGGTSDSGDTYHNGGSGWDPIGRSWSPSDSTHFNAVFDGNGHSIHNLYVNRNRNYGGLFAVLRGNAVVRSLGLPNAYVDISQQGSAAPLAGSSWGRVEASWASGSVAGNTNVGGLVGSTAASSVIVASYSKAGAQCGAGSAGGLVGGNGGTIVASYATGAITGSCAATNKHGLAGYTGTAARSHWDRETSGVATSDQGAGRTTAQLQTPTSATGIFAGWADLDVDGDGDPHESPWDFGKSSHYPALSYRGADPVPQRGDYDYDDDGLIEVRTWRS